MTQPVKAGLAYFSVVFAVGFVLGTVRVVGVAPWLGPVAAVALEIPLILIASALACRWAIRRYLVRAQWRPRAVMGGVAFAILMLAEFGLSYIVFGLTPAEYFENFRSVQGLMGLAAQIVFGVMPLTSLWRITPAGPDRLGRSRRT